MSVSITKKPLIPVVKIKKNDNTYYECNHHTATYDFRIVSFSAEPAFDSVSGRFNVTITHPTQSTLATILTNINQGNEVEIYIGKTSSTTKIFLGTIEDIEIHQEVKDFMLVTISGPDWGSDILQHRVVNGYWEQSKTADGETLDVSDNSTLVEQIVKDLLQKSGSYITPGITAEDQGIVINSAYIESTNIRLPQFAVNAEMLEDKLAELDSIANTIHWVDADKNFHLAYHVNTMSGVLITDTPSNATALAWDQTKVGLMGRPVDIRITAESHMRRLFGLGGDQRKIDQSSETITNYSQTDTNYLAQKFTPRYRTCDMIGLYLAKNGSPSANITMQLIEDYGGQPIGTTIRRLDLAKADVSSSGKWNYFKIGEELNTAKSYWILLEKNGTGTDYYKWYRAASGTATNGYSTNGSDWTAPNGLIQTSSYAFAFRQYYTNPLLTILEDTGLTATTKHLHETVYRKPDITSDALLRNLLMAESTTAFKKKEIIEMPVFAPDTLLMPGQLIRILKLSGNYTMDNYYLITDLTYNFENSGANATGNFWYNITAMRFMTF